jgi:hypothetical protein
VGNPRNIRFDDLLEKRIVVASKEDSRTFSDEVRELVKAGLRHRRRKAIAKADEL